MKYLGIVLVPLAYVYHDARFVKHEVFCLKSGVVVLNLVVRRPDLCTTVLDLPIGLCVCLRVC